MRALLWIVCVMLLTSFRVLGQNNSFSSTLTDRYVNAYSGQPEYRSMSMTEDMIKNIRKNGVWGNPNFDQFMSQVKLYRHISFKTDIEQFGIVSAKIINELKNDRSYKLYFMSGQNGVGSYFYTLTVNNKIKELSFIVFDKTRSLIGVSSFASDDINTATIHKFVVNQ